MNTTIGCPIPGASQPKEPVRLIDAYALKKRCVKVMFRDMPECGEFYAVGTGDIDIMPTIDPESMRPTEHWNIERTDCRDVILCWKCDKCGRLSRDDYPYCPHCGARMVNEND